MSEDQALEILKQAILLEKRGKSFYENSSKGAQNQALKDFFTTMAEEEALHIRILSDQFKAYRDHKQFRLDADAAEQSTDVSSAVLSEALKNRIAAADFEAAAISAAMAMEERAIKLYAGRAASATNETEKQLYQWLASWEATHLETLAEIDKALTEQVWNDNSFWPF